MWLSSKLDGNTWRLLNCFLELYSSFIVFFFYIQIAVLYLTL